MSEDVRIIHGDSLQILPTLEAGSVDAIVTDPPYHRVKAEAWDNQWKDDESYLEWLGRVADEWKRVLKPSGSLYCFASPRMASRVESLIAQRFNVVNAITWQKDFPCGALKYGAENFRGFVEMSERIVFAEHRNYLGELLRTRREDAGLSRRDIDIAIRGKGTGLSYRWEEGDCLPSPEQWYQLGAMLELPAYAEVARPFFAREDRPHTDVWTFAPVAQARLVHPCEKPLPLLKHVIEVSTREGDLVLDSFAGSGSTLAACMKTGRRCIGIELDQKYIPVIERRTAAAETPLFS